MVERFTDSGHRADPRKPVIATTPSLREPEAIAAGAKGLVARVEARGA